MSYLHWEPVHSNHYLPRGETTGGAVERRPHRHPADVAIDTALRNVPLPEGLLTRLDKFVQAMTDGPTDSIDYLGC